MSNINDYLDWRGDIPISEEFGINEIDNMIFARISYLLFGLGIGTVVCYYLTTTFLPL